MEDLKTNTETDELLFRCLEGVASDAEYEEAWRWIHQSPKNKAYYSKMRNVWIGLSKPVDAERQQQVWAQLEKKILASMVRRKNIRMKYLGWAAAAAIIAFAYILGTQTPPKQEDRELAAITTEEYIIEAPKGGKSVMTLSDGSKVWLNAGSTLHVDETFGKENRTLKLQGEAYFEVAHNRSAPFIVRTDAVDVKVLGTHFNVRAYNGESDIAVSLVSGSVSLHPSGKEQLLTCMEPDQLATVSRADLSWQKTPCDAQTEACWHLNKLKFDGESVEKTWEKLGKWYNVKVSLKHYDPATQYWFSVETESLQELLSMIDKLTPVEYELNDKEVAIWYK